MCISFTSFSKSFIFYYALFIGLSVLPELILIGVDCASFSHLSSVNYDQHRLVKWSLALASITLLFKLIQLFYLYTYSISHCLRSFIYVIPMDCTQFVHFAFGYLDPYSCERRKVTSSITLCEYCSIVNDTDIHINCMFWNNRTSVVDHSPR
jgi:hypothetical protein